MAAPIPPRWSASLLLLLALAGAAALPAAETLTVSFATTSAGGQFSPDNIVAVWVETQAGAFVKTIGDWSRTRRSDLSSWRAKAGTSDTDAVMGATRSNHTGTLTVTWNMLPRGGTTAVADGTYTVRFELRDTNQHYTGVSFVKNGTASTVGPVTQGGYNNITLTYTGRTAAAPAITSASAASGTVGSAFSYAITANNAPTAFSASGLPTGLTVNTTTGVISGTPTSTGTSSVTIGASNAGGAGTATLTLTVTAPVAGAPQITSATTASGALTHAFAYAIAATNTPTSYSASGLPAGLAVNTANGAISGTPTVAGTFTVALGATNGSGTGHATVTLTILGAPVISSALTVSATSNAPFSYAITASPSPSAYSASGLPPGLMVDTASGMITGTPASAGTSAITIGASNTAGSDSATLMLTVSDPIAGGGPSASAQGPGHWGYGTGYAALLLLLLSLRALRLRPRAGRADD